MCPKISNVNDVSHLMYLGNSPLIACTSMAYAIVKNTALRFPMQPGNHCCYALEEGGLLLLRVQYFAILLSLAKNNSNPRNMSP